MYLFFDTETTGIPAGADYIHAVQLAWVLQDDCGVTKAEADFIIRPEGFTIPDEVAKIHGITTAIANTEGVALANVMSLFVSALYLTNRIAGHSLNFDIKILLKEFERLNWKTEAEAFGSKDRFCTMEASNQFCDLRKKDGKPKFPKLSELYQKLFGRDFANAHNAKADIKATIECFWELRRKGLI